MLPMSVRIEAGVFSFHYAMFFMLPRLLVCENERSTSMLDNYLRRLVISRGVCHRYHDVWRQNFGRPDGEVRRLERAPRKECEDLNFES